jgi:hypothetical protein
MATMLRVGARVRVTGYSGDYVVADLRAAEGRATVRGVDPIEATEVVGHYGSQLIQAKERYFWLSSDIAALSVIDGVPAGVVTRLVEKYDQDGGIKQAEVSGMDRPVTAFDEPSWPQFVERLKAYGFIAPPDVQVEEAGTRATRTLGEVLAMEAVQ